MAAERARLLGVEIDSLRADELMNRISGMASDGRSHHVCYVNAECLNQAIFDRRYRAILHEADLVYADGTGVVWASRLTAHPLPERITLGDALPQLCQMAVAQNLRFFLLGGSPGVAERAREWLEQRFPGLAIAGVHDGYFAADNGREVIDQINQAHPHILLVGMGVPKQEKWLWQHRDELRVPVLWGVGALFDYYAGKTPHAPVWLRRLGFEWFFRLLVEPQRLWRRYLLGNAFFIVRACALLLIDAILVTLAWLGAYQMCQWLDQPLGVTINPIDPYLRSVALIVGVWLVTCATFGLYRRSATMSPLAEFAQVIRATWLGLLSTMAVAFLFREASFGRPVVLLSAVLTFVLLSTSRLITRACEQRLARHGIGLRRVLIVGTGSLAKRLKEEIEIWPVGYEVVGFVADGGDSASVASKEILGPVKELGGLIHRWDIQDVFVASENLQFHQELNLLASQERWPVDFHLVSEELEPFAQRVPLDRVVELPLLQLPHVKADGWYEGTKRLFDLILSSAGLLVFLPLFGLIALVIKLESGGPALFIQERIGRGGRRFLMYKFRTMSPGTPAYDVAPNDLADPRVTPFGRFLRRWSLDELPQLLNVFRGAMSVVGPRPEMLFLVQQYEPWQKRRLMVKPGLTGLWQVVGRKELPLQRNIEYDLYYVRHRGWLLDAAILLRTVPAVLLRRGAF